MDHHTKQLHELAQQIKVKDMESEGAECQVFTLKLILAPDANGSIEGAYEKAFNAMQDGLDSAGLDGDLDVHNRNQVRQLFVEWHVDEATNNDKAGRYADALLKRLEGIGLRL